MKILFISSPPFFDFDLSLVSHLSNCCDVQYLMELPSYFLSTSALKIEKQIKVNDIVDASNYKEFEKFDKYIPLTKFKIINRTTKKAFTISNLKLQLKIWRFVKKENPDIIHCNTFIHFGAFSIFLFRKTTKILLNVHDPLPHSGEDSFRRKILTFLNFLFIKNIVLLNSTQKCEFERKYQSKFQFKRIFVSSLGIYEYLRDYPIIHNNCNTINFLFFGRISPYKGIDVLLEAFSAIANSFDTHLTIAGSGKFDFDISEYKTNPKITFINRYIANQELVNLIVNSSVVVCPYKDATQSGVVMSAFALNKPVLATKVGALPEMIVDGLTGYLIPPNDSFALSSKLIEIMNRPEILLQMKRNIEIQTQFGEKSWVTIVKNLSDIYNTILKQ